MKKIQNIIILFNKVALYYIKKRFLDGKRNTLRNIFFKTQIAQNLIGEPLSYQRGK